MTAKNEKSEFERFSDLTTRLLNVSKEEINRREAEWKKQREQQKKRGSKRPSGRGASRDSDACNE